MLSGMIMLLILYKGVAPPVKSFFFFAASGGPRRARNSSVKAAGRPSNWALRVRGAQRAQFGGLTELFLAPRGSPRGREEEKGPHGGINPLMILLLVYSGRGFFAGV